MSPTVRNDRATSVRQALPVHRLLALVVHHLEATGDPARGAAPVRGVDLEVEAGTLVLLNPPDGGRTVILCLSGELEGVQLASSPSTDGGPAWRCEVVPALDTPDASSPPQADQLLEQAGPGALRAAQRLGLAADLDSDVRDLPVWKQILVQLARTCGSAPDVVALDNPAGAMSTDGTVALLTAIRALIDTEGRTVLVTCDLQDIPAGARVLADQIVDIKAATGVC